MKNDGEHGSEHAARGYPHYRIQCWDERVSAWRDIQHGFRSLEALRHFARVNLEESQRTRVVLVKGYRARRILQEESVFARSGAQASEGPDNN